MPVRNFLIKPASSLCNMRCRYCFYEDESENRMIKNMGIMAPEVAERLVGLAFEGLTRKDAVTFAFQGGEPTLAGLEYFQRFVQAVEQYNTCGASVQYAIQTNGLCINEDWAIFFKKHDFLVGVSVDGDKALHDGNRLDHNGKGTWTRVKRGVDRLLATGVEVNLLCVVTKQCTRSPQRVYNALKKIGVDHLQFIACLDPLNQTKGQTPWSLLPEDYGKFLCGLFDVWYRDWENGCYTSVRLFDDLVHLAMGLPSGTCATSGSCGAYFVIEGDGGVYPCDFYVLDQWKLGNLMEHSLEELARTPRAVQFLVDGTKKPAECATCSWKSLCNGGCKRDWVEIDGEIHNYYCASFRTFFAYAGDRLAVIARTEYAARRHS